MDLDKTLLLPAPPEKVWALLLDPEVMGACVPGMQGIEVLSPTEYRALMVVKLAFITARFRIKTTVLEQRAPHYLKTSGVGDDASAASSFKQTSELFLEPAEGGATSLRMTIHADLLGRLGTFGLAVMKTKADRLWDEFGVNLAARLAPVVAPEAAPVGAPGLHHAAEAAPDAGAATAPGDGAARQPSAASSVGATSVPAGAMPAASLWQRWFGPREAIQVVVVRGDTRIEVRWPLQGQAQCAAWLRELAGAARP
jgi:uncharacterized protein